MLFYRRSLAVAVFWSCAGNAACGSGTSVSGDGGDKGDSVDGGGQGDSVGCDPSAQGCPSGITCDIICLGGKTQLACRPLGESPIAVGGSCGGASTRTIAQDLPAVTARRGGGFPSLSDKKAAAPDEDPAVS